MVEHFPMTVYVRYVDLFHDNGTIYMRRFPVTSVTSGLDFLQALKTLGILTNEDRWQLRKWENEDYAHYFGSMYMEREILWIFDGDGEYASFMVFPSDQDAIEEFQEEELTNVVRVDFKPKPKRA